MGLMGLMGGLISPMSLIGHIWSLGSGGAKGPGRLPTPIRRYADTPARLSCNRSLPLRLFGRKRTTCL